MSVHSTHSRPAWIGKIAAAFKEGAGGASLKDPAFNAGGSGDPVRRIAKIMRDPLFVFFVFGALVFAAFALRPGADNDVVLTRDQIDGMTENFTLLRGREPAQEEIEELKREYITSELLFLEAQEQGLHLSDAKVREIMIENVKRQLIGEIETPETADLIEYYSSHTGLYRTERSYTFKQVFFLQPPGDPNALRARLNDGEDVKGDPFWQGLDFPEYGASMLRGLFNQDFVDRLEAAPTDEWIGPLQTARGWHYVRVSEKIEPRLLPFARVRNQVENDYLASIAAEKIAARMEELEAKYDVRIEP